MTADFAAQLRQHRTDRGLSVRQLAELAHCGKSHIHDLETGRRRPTAAVVHALDDALDANGQLTAAHAGAGAFREPWRMDGGLWRPSDSERLAVEIASTEPTADNAVELAHQWLITEPPQVYEVRAGRRIGARTVAEVERRVHQLRLLDDHVGGTDTHAMVTAELAATTHLLQQAAVTEDLARRLLVAIGELCQLAGWTLSDAGRYADAERHYLLGVRAAHAGGDVAGAANNLSSLAYQVANVGDPRTAETLARSAYAGARRDASATTRALLSERVAWAAARTGEARAAERALGDVEDDYERRQPNDDPEWVYWLNADEIEVMAGRVWTELRRPLRAVPILERAVSGYGEDTGRETALYLSWLAQSLLQANEVDRAAEMASEVLRLSRGAGSVRAGDRVTLLADQLAAHRGNPAVDAFEEQLAAEVG